MQDHDLQKVVEIRSKKRKENKPRDDVSVGKSKSKALMVMLEKCSPPLIYADQYASRTTMLSSLAVAWSPVSQSTSENGPLALSNSSSAVLCTIGGKSGKISFWRICEPQCYLLNTAGFLSLRCLLDSPEHILDGSLQSVGCCLLWVVQILRFYWLLGVLMDDLGNSEELMKSPEINYTPFSLLKKQTDNIHQLLLPNRKCKMSFSRGFSQIPRNRLHGCFRWFLSQQQYHLRSLLSNRFQSPSDFTRKVLGCREIYSWGLLALHVFQRQIHHEHNSIIEEELDPFSLVAEELSIFANRLRSMVVAEVPKFASAAEYFFKMSVEGKRFRPTVLLLMATALNGNIPEYDSIKVGESVTSDLRMQQQNVAEITEMIHVASLIHNDVLDDVDTRSEIGSLNFVMGNKVLSLLATVFDLVTGETMQMTTTSDQRCSIEYYLQKTYFKTALPISNSCQAIALLAGQTAEVSMLAFEYGKNMGLAFQLIDDVLDFTGTPTSLGKGSLSSPWYCYGSNIVCHRRVSSTTCSC